MTQESLRAQIGMVTQDTSLLHRSVRDNIRYGRPDASDDEIVAAAAAAQAHEFIVELGDRQGRNGYDAHVGERGVKLSGGQRQRIAIARVMLKNAPILVLDEATSALDSEVEAAIQAQPGTLMQGRTVIAIAHRLSTIAQMDRLDRARPAAASSNRARMPNCCAPAAITPRSGAASRAASSTLENSRRRSRTSFIGQTNAAASPPECAAAFRVRRPVMKQIEQMAVVRHDVGWDRRMRPVGAPHQPLRIGAHQRVMERPRIRIVGELHGQAIGRRQFDVCMSLTDELQQRLEVFDR